MELSNDKRALAIETTPQLQVVLGDECASGGDGFSTPDGVRAEKSVRAANASS
jgi:hypothetical protein